MRSQKRVQTIDQSAIWQARKSLAELDSDLELGLRLGLGHGMAIGSGVWRPSWLTASLLPICKSRLQNNYTSTFPRAKHLHLCSCVSVRYSTFLGGWISELESWNHNRNRTTATVQMRRLLACWFKRLIDNK